jgi:hypothetical protein
MKSAPGDSTTTLPSRYERLKAEADRLLAAGDTAMTDGKIAEGKRLLRACRRKRLEAREEMNSGR